VADISFQEGANKLLAAIQQQQQADNSSRASDDPTLHPGAAAQPVTEGAGPQQQEQQQPQDQDQQQQQQQQQQLQKRSASSAYVHATKLKALFQLWDLDGDGFVSFQELCIGLAKFKPIRHKQVGSCAAGRGPIEQKHWYVGTATTGTAMWLTASACG
jgi:hypothetical protein